MTVTIFAAALFAASPLPAAPLTPVAALTDLAAQPLAAGRQDEALAVLEKANAADPHDAAILINLGIAHAQRGDDDKARAAFEAALACHEVIELETAEGVATDSRRLARKAIKMLERGEFRPVAQRGDQLSYRD